MSITIEFQDNVRRSHQEFQDNARRSHQEFVDNARRSHQEFTNYSSSSNLNSTNRGGTHGVFIILSIISAVFLFDSFQNFQDEHFIYFLYMSIWSGAYTLPILAWIITRTSKTVNLVYKLTVMITTIDWGFGWYLMSLSEWSIIKDNFVDIYNLIWAYQIIFILFTWTLYGEYVEYSYESQTVNGSTTVTRTMVIRNH